MTIPQRGKGDTQNVIKAILRYNSPLSSTFFRLFSFSLCNNYRTLRTYGPVRLFRASKRPPSVLCGQKVLQEKREISMRFCFLLFFFPPPPPPPLLLLVLLRACFTRNDAMERGTSPQTPAPDRKYSKAEGWSAPSTPPSCLATMTPGDGL